MTEAARIYREEVSNRSRISRSVHNKKHGSGTQKLGNRKMSWQEIAGKHGDISKWCLKDFLTWDIFVQMPDDLKVEYVDKLCDEYDISIQHISQYLFNKGGDGLRAHLRNNRDKDGKRLFDKCDTLKPRANSGLLRFRKDIDKWKKRVAAAEAIDRMEEEARREEAPEFITYDQFKELTPEAMVAFLNSLIDYYGVGYSTIAKKVFQVSEGCVYSKLKIRKVHDQIHLIDSKTSRTAEYKEKVDRLIKDVDIWRAGMDAKNSDQESNIVDFPIVNQQQTIVVDPYSGTTFRVDENDIKEAIKEATDILNEKHAESVTLQEFIDTITDPIEEPASETIVEVASDPMLHHDSSFISNYIRVGLDMDELMALGILFKNKKVRVNIEITELD